MAEPKTERKKAFKPDYTASEIIELYQQRSQDGDEKRLRDISTTMRALCRLEHEVDIPGEYRQIAKDVRTPFVRDNWQRISTSLVSKPPVNHITPLDEKKEEYRDAANIGERFDTAMIERLNKERGVDIDYNLTCQLVRDGESVLKVVHRPDAWANFPEGKDTEEQDRWKRGVDLPIAWKDVDRQCMVYEGGEYGDEWVIEYGEYTKPFLKARYKMQDDDLQIPATTLEGSPYPEGLNPKSTGRSIKVEFMTAREWHVIINGVEAKGWPKPNPYAPYLPYFRAPAYDLESLLYSLIFLVPRLDELLTMKLNWSYLGAYPNPVIKTMPQPGGIPDVFGAGLTPVGSGEGVAGEKLTWKPGKAMILPVGKDMSFLTPPPVGKDLNDLVVIFKSLIDIAGIPSIMRGMSGAGDSGYLANQLRQAAEMAYKLAAIALQRQREKALEFSHWLVKEKIQQTVYVLGWSEINPKTGRPTKGANNAWLGLSPDHQGKNIADVTKLGPVTCKYRPRLVTDDQAAAMIAIQLTNAQKPLYGRRDALEKLMQEEDADSILQNLDVDQAINEEPLRSMWINAGLEDAGMLPKQQSQQPQLVDQYGNPLPMSNGMAGVPFGNAAPPGMAGIPGLTMPLQPQAPQGVPGANGGRVAGAYPGLPGGPNQ